MSFNYEVYARHPFPFLLGLYPLSIFLYTSLYYLEALKHLSFYMLFISRAFVRHPFFFFILASLVESKSFSTAQRLAQVQTSSDSSVGFSFFPVGVENLRSLWYFQRSTQSSWSLFLPACRPHNSRVIFAVFLFTWRHKCTSCFYNHVIYDVYQKYLPAIPRIQKMVLDPFVLKTKHYKFFFISRVKLSNPGKSTYWKGSLWITLDYGRQFLFYIYI